MVRKQICCCVVAKVNQSEVCQSDSVIYDTSAMNIYDGDGHDTWLSPCMLLQARRETTSSLYTFCKGLTLRQNDCVWSAASSSSVETAQKILFSLAGKGGLLEAKCGLVYNHICTFGRCRSFCLCENNTYCWCRLAVVLLYKIKIYVTYIYSYHFLPLQAAHKSHFLNCFSVCMSGCKAAKVHQSEISVFENLLLSLELLFWGCGCSLRKKKKCMGTLRLLCFKGS